MTSAMRDQIAAVVVDWDETITEEDTMAILSHATKDPARWPEFVDAYMADLEEQERAFGERETLAAHFEFLGSLGPVEMKSVRRIEQSGVFRGITHGAIRDAADRVVLRDGFETFCENLASGIMREILSVNWSDEFIRHALDGKVEVSLWTITANHIYFGEDGSATGKVSKDQEGGLRTGLDKLGHLERRKASVRETQGGDKLLVYIGDSNTDLPCLLEADIGIVFGNNTSLQKNLDKYGIEVRPWTKVDRTVPYVKTDRTLFRVTAWTQVFF